MSAKEIVFVLLPISNFDERREKRRKSAFNSFLTLYGGTVRDLWDDDIAGGQWYQVAIEGTFGAFVSVLATGWEDEGRVLRSSRTDPRVKVKPVKKPTYYPPAGRSVDLRTNETRAEVKRGPDYVYVAFWRHDNLDHQLSFPVANAKELAAEILRAAESKCL